MSLQNKRMLLVLIVLIVMILYSFISYIMIKVPNHEATAFEQRLYTAVHYNEPFDMKDITTFQWDQMKVFGPYTTRSEMEEVVGRKWTTRSYFGYLLDRTALGDHPLSDDSYHKLVFTHKGKVVLDVTLNRWKADFTQVPRNIDAAHSKFNAAGNVVSQD